MNNNKTLTILLSLLGVAVAILAVAVGVYFGVTMSDSSSSREASGSPTSSVSSAQPSPSAAESSTETTSESSPTPEARNCTVDAHASEVLMAIHEASEKYPNEFGWTYQGVSNYSPCAELSYAMLRQEKIGNSQFATLLLFFHDGEYLGVDSTYPQQVQKIEENGDALDVIYRDWEALEKSGKPNAAAPDYNSNVHYYWDGDSVQYDGRIPNTHLGSR